MGLSGPIIGQQRSSASKKTRGYETFREENLDSIRPEQPFGTANLPPSRARAPTFALILDKSETEFSANSDSSGNASIGLPLLRFQFLLYCREDALE